MQEIWVVEYSPEQEMVHIDTLDMIIEINRNNLLRDVYPGYVPLYATSKYTDACYFAGAFMDKLQNNTQELF